MKVLINTYKLLYLSQTVYHFSWLRITISFCNTGEAFCFGEEVLLCKRVMCTWNFSQGIVIAENNI